MKGRSLPPDKLLRLACVLGLVALPLMVWSVFVPRVWPVLIALSVGQVIGTTSFLLYIVAVVRDLGVVQKLRGGAPRSGSDGGRGGG